MIINVHAREYYTSIRRQSGCAAQYRYSIFQQSMVLLKMNRGIDHLLRDSR